MIAGKRILINPAGGLYRHPDLNMWIFQHEHISGLVPDILTMDFAGPVAELLTVVGANTYCTRHLDRAGAGESEQSRWHECATTNLKAMKLPEEIWGKGNTPLEKDINARLNYAEYIKMDCIVNITFSTSPDQKGMEFWYNNPDAKRLAESVRDNLMKIDRKNLKEKSLKEDVHEEHPLVCRTKIPSIEVCIFNLRDVSENWLAKQSWMKMKVATGIFGGIYKMFE